MSEVKIQFNTDNDAFLEARSLQIATCLRQVAMMVEHGHLEGKIRDPNGNHIGHYNVGDDDAE